MPCLFVAVAAARWDQFVEHLPQVRLSPGSNSIVPTAAVLAESDDVNCQNLYMTAEYKRLPEVHLELMRPLNNDVDKFRIRSTFDSQQEHDVPRG